MSRAGTTTRLWKRWLGVASAAALAWAFVVSGAVGASAADGDTVIKVRVAGDRTGSDTVGAAVGATVTLYNSNDVGGAVVSEAVTDGSGEATFTLAAGQVPAGTGLTARVTKAPTGLAPADPELDRQWEGIQYVIGNVTPGRSYTYGYDIATVRDNPPTPQACGLDVALIIDVSGSVASYEPDLKAAAKAYVNALLGTPSQVQLFTFNSSAQVLSGLTSVSTQAGADTLNTKIDTLDASGLTNWNKAMWLAAEQPGAFDVAVVITDGEPTTGGHSRADVLDAGIYSANALKAEGTSVVALGVGSGVGSTEAALTLAAISGPQVGVDYFQSGTYDDAALALRDMVFAACAPSLTVVKQVVPDGGGDAVPTGGWTFDATASANIITAGSGTTDDATGAVNFPLDFVGSTDPGTVTLTERQQPGFSLVQNQGGNAVCTVKNVDHPLGTPLSVTNAGTLGFTIAVGPGDLVSCTVTNQAPSASWTPEPTATPEPPGSTTPTSTPGAASGGGLAVTGANAGTVVGLAALILALGAVLTVVARRRMAQR